MLLLQSFPLSTSFHFSSSRPVNQAVVGVMIPLFKDIKKHADLVCNKQVERSLWLTERKKRRKNLALGPLQIQMLWQGKKNSMPHLQDRAPTKERNTEKSNHLQLFFDIAGITFVQAHKLRSIFIALSMTCKKAPSRREVS